MGREHESTKPKKHKIIILTGQSASGKDTIANKLVNNKFKRIVTNTTRPPREGEVDGVDYNFINEYDFYALIAVNDMIEWHKYNTAFGAWYYGSDARNINLDKHDYVIVLTLDGVESYVKYFGAENCIVFYIDCPKSIREERAKKRGSFNQSEWNRRVITDKQDFTTEKVAKVCNFKVANYNKKLYNVIKEIESDIKIWKS